MAQTQSILKKERYRVTLCHNKESVTFWNYARDGEEAAKLALMAYNEVRGYSKFAPINGEIIVAHE